MLNPGLDLRLFRYAIVSAERGSFRRAAAALNVQQSSISKGVQLLEHRIGIPLFERTHAGVRPTPAGVKFLREATVGFDHLERAMLRIGAVRRGEHDELTVSASVPFFLLGDVFERFRDDYPSVPVEMVEGTCNASIALVEQRKADVAFVTRIEAGGAAQSLHLRDERMLAVLPNSHRLSRVRVLTLEELRHETFVLGTGGLGPYVVEHLRRHLVGEGGGPNLLLHRIGQCDLVSMVARGFGITIVVGYPRRPAPKGAVLVPLAGPNIIPIYAVWMRSNPKPALKALLTIAQQMSRPDPGSV